jgi:hypothetical protein
VTSRRHRRSIHFFPLCTTDGIAAMLRHSGPDIYQSRPRGLGWGCGHRFEVWVGVFWL